MHSMFNPIWMFLLQKKKCLFLLSFFKTFVSFIFLFVSSFGRDLWNFISVKWLRAFTGESCLVIICKHLVHFIFLSFSFKFCIGFWNCFLSTTFLYSAAIIFQAFELYYIFFSSNRTFLTFVGFFFFSFLITIEKVWCLADGLLDFDIDSKVNC